MSPAVGVALGAEPPRRLRESEFERFHARCAKPLWAYIHRMCGNRATADDLLQKTFIRLLQAPSLPPDESGLKAYAYRVATNVVFDHFRSSRSEESAVPDAPLPWEPEAILRADVARIFARLKPQERALLWLAHVEGYDHSELAKMVGVKEKSVRVLLFRARRRLAAMLEKEGMTETRP